jgi:hypothetical protein
MDFQRLFPEIFVDESRKEGNLCFKFSMAIDEFNGIRQTTYTHNQLR